MAFFNGSYSVPIQLFYPHVFITYPSKASKTPQKRGFKKAIRFFHFASKNSSFFEAPSGGLIRMATKNGSILAAIRGGVGRCHKAHLSDFMYSLVRLGCLTQIRGQKTGDPFRVWPTILMSVLSRLPIAWL
jgi:hypothetical protein